MLVALIGTNTTLLWVLLPLAVLFAGLAPAAISFAAGQAAFTLTLLILFNILAPEGWQIGLVRIEDVAIGCAVSLAVGPAVLAARRRRRARPGAGRGLRRQRAATSRAPSRFGIGRCDAGRARRRPRRPSEALRAAAAARRLDDTFRSYLAERGAKPVPLAEVTSLVTGVVGLRLAGDAVLDLWQPATARPAATATAARQELLASTERDDAAGTAPSPPASPATGDAARAAGADDRAGGPRLVDAVGHDLRGDDGQATATAVRMIWTGDHLDAARRLQGSLVEPARAAASVNALR